MDITIIVGLASLLAAGVGLLMAHKRGALVPSRGRDTMAMTRTLRDLWKNQKLSKVERLLIFGGIAVSHSILIGGIPWNWVFGV